MPLDSFPSSSALLVPPAPSTARLVSAGSPSSTSKVQAVVVEELALASMGVLEAALEAPPADDLVEIWARTRKGGARRRAAPIEAVRLMKPEPPSHGAELTVAPTRSGRAIVVFAALAAIIVLGLAALALRLL